MLNDYVLSSFLLSDKSVMKFIIICENSLSEINNDSNSSVIFSLKLFVH